MKKLLLLSAMACLSLVACKKDDDGNTNPANNNTACNGKNLCMKVDGTQFSEDAKWLQIPNNNNRFRILWETGSGNNYKNVEIDFYGPVATGTYTVVAQPANTGEAGFQYFVNDNGNTRNIAGQSGTMQITSVANNQLTGTFTVTADDGTNTVQITDGNFVSVPQ